MTFVRVRKLFMVCLLLPAAVAMAQAGPQIVQEDAPQPQHYVPMDSGNGGGAMDCSCFTDHTKPCFTDLLRLLEEKSDTYDRMKLECTTYLNEVARRASSKTSQVEAVAGAVSGVYSARVGDGAGAPTDSMFPVRPRARHRYWLGADTTESMTLKKNDLVQLGAALLNNPFGNCFDYAWLGMCITPIPPFPKSPYVEYRWPEQLTEAVKDRAMTGYLWESIAKQKAQTAEDIVISGLLSAQISGMGSDEYANIIKPGMESLGYQLPGLSSDGSQSAADRALEMATSRNFESRADNVDGPGFLRTEYRVQRLGPLMTVLEEQLDKVEFPYAWKGFCHDRKEDANNASISGYSGCFWSESEGFMTSRFATLGTNAGADGIQQKLNNPLACSLYNMTQGTRRFRTPRDLLAPLYRPYSDFTLTKYCSTGNQGNEYALLNTVNATDRRTATEQAVLRGTDAPGDAADAFGLYEYIDEFRGGEDDDHDDQVQWTNDQAMVDKIGENTCVDLTPKTMHYPRDFTLAERDVDTMAKIDNFGGDGEVDPFWMVAHQWHRFRCCKDLLCFGLKCDQKIED